MCSGSRRAPAAWLLAYDIAQLTLLTMLTGGIENPFAFLILAPVLIAAISLPLRYTLPLGAFAVACSTLIAFFFWPLPWTADNALVLPPLYILAIWIANLVAIVFIGAYAWQVAEEGRLMADALTATELVLAREQHLSQLDGLAAAAAHELGTPLSTIAVVAKELQHALGPDSPHAEDVKLLREQAQRCREILGKLSALPSGWAPFERVKLSGLIEEVVAPHRNFGIAIDVVLPPERAAEPVVARSPAILYGLGNLVENAVDFAAERVEIAVRWSEQDVAVTISDDGPGFKSGDPGAHRRALCDEPPPSGRRKRGERAGPGLLHRQDAAGALRREPRLPQPARPRAGRRGAGALGARRISRRRRRAKPPLSNEAMTHSYA